MHEMYRSVLLLFSQSTLVRVMPFTLANKVLDDCNNDNLEFNIIWFYLNNVTYALPHMEYIEHVPQMAKILKTFTMLCTA